MQFIDILHIHGYTCTNNCILTASLSEFYLDIWRYVNVLITIIV